MSAKAKDLRSYLEELQKTKEARREQVREGLENNNDLWRKAKERGAEAETDPVDSAQAKIQRQGAHNKAAGEK